jgi:thymidylate synthase
MDISNSFPLLTTKRVFWRGVAEELLFFISGQTDTKILEAKGVNIWKGNTSREFLDKRGLHNLKEGEYGKSYGYQWRHFGARYNCFTGKRDLENSRSEGIDQLQQIIDQLKNPETRNSRRLIMTAWNPTQLDEMALPPCHIMCQFNVHDGNKLSCAMYQRSVDVMLGQPFNIASYAMLTHLLAKHCGLEAHEFVHFMGNCHIYEEHIEGAKEQVLREPYNFPELNILQVRENINDYRVEDFEIVEYKSHPVIKFKMIA